MRKSILDIARAITVYIVEDGYIASDDEGVRYHLFLTWQAAQDYKHHLEGQVVDDAAIRMKMARLTFPRTRRGRRGR